MVTKLKFIQRHDGNLFLIPIEVIVLDEKVHTKYLIHFQVRPGEFWVSIADLCLLRIMKRKPWVWCESLVSAKAKDDD